MRWQISPDALVFSHPLDQVVEQVIRGTIATIRSRKAEDDEFTGRSPGILGLTKSRKW
jgi:hypothetical protein